MATTTLDALREAVIAAPEDDAPRVAYADAIESTDPVRAEFIRLQLALARCRREHLNTDNPPVAPQTTLPAYCYEGELSRKYGDEWAKDLKDLTTWFVFIRGFVEWVRFDAAEFLRIAPELYRRAPVLHLELKGVKPVAEELFRSPHLSRIVSMHLWGNDLEDAEAMILACSPHLGRLAWLELGNNKIGEAGLEALAASDRLPRVGYVGFMFNAIENPTPTHADGYDSTSTLARRWMEKYGHREWLDAYERPVWPPNRHEV